VHETTSMHYATHLPDCYIVAGGLMEHDEEGFAVVPEQQQQQMQEVEGSTSTQNELYNSKHSAALDSTGLLQLETELGTYRRGGLTPELRCQRSKRNELHAAAVYRFAQDVLAIVSHACWIACLLACFPCLERAVPAPTCMCSKCPGL
jgi:hypothetical protein